MKNIILLLGSLLKLASVCAQSGVLDSSYGTDGKVFISSPANGYTACYTSFLQKDNKMILGGHFTALDIKVPSGFMIERFTVDGNIDLSFGENGRVVTNYQDTRAISVFSVAQQMDGKLLAAGYGYNGYFSTDEGPLANANFVLVRYNTDGKVDTSFGKEGIVDIDFGSVEQGQSILIQPDGKIVMTGTRTWSPDILNKDILTVRYNTDGSLDENFGDNGKIIAGLSFGSNATCIALQPDGKILVGGTYADLFDPRFLILRYLPDGKPDSSFGTNGKTSTDFPGSYDRLDAITLKPDGKIIVAGHNEFTREFPNKTLALASYNIDGSLDNTFGKDGKVVAGSLIQSTATGIALQKNGKIVLSAIVSKANTNNNAGLFRYTENGIPDSIFGVNGIVITDFGFSDEMNGVFLQSDGKIIMGGSSIDFVAPTNYYLAIARYEGDPINQHPLITKIKRWIRNHILHFEDINTNAAYYVIEKSTASNGAFVPVTKITANATTNNYSYTLPETATQSTYRIKAVNKDNSITYSSPISSSDPAKAGVATFKVYPNPAKDRITVETSGTVQLRLQNSKGRVLLTQTVNGKGSIDISKLPNGIYYVVNTVNGESLKVVKE